jgi:hypothetical protein
VNIIIMDALRNIESLAAGILAKNLSAGSTLLKSTSIDRDNESVTPRHFPKIPSSSIGLSHVTRLRSIIRLGRPLLSA